MASLAHNEFNMIELDVSKCNHYLHLHQSQADVIIIVGLVVYLCNFTEKRMNKYWFHW